MFSKAQLAVLLFPFLIFGQNYLEVGDKYFNHNNFRQAIAYYEKESQNPEREYQFLASERLATTYQKLHEFELAENWLRTALKIKPQNANLVLQLADIQKKRKNYIEAKKFYITHFDLAKDELSLRKAAFCDSIISWEKQNIADYEIREFNKANSAYRDFSAILFGDSVIFVSDRESSTDGNKGILNHKYSIPHLDFFKLGLKIQGVPNQEIKVESFNDIKTGHHEGPLSIYTNDTTKTLIFTRTNKGLKSQSQHVHPTQLFTSIYLNGKWSEPNNEFKMNSIEHSTGHPSVSRDGKTIVFMADAGSNFNNSNIYVGKWNPSTSNWSQFRPMGDHINTEFNELYPFFDAKMNLYFSSAGLPGYGGLDIFFSKYNPIKDDWEKPINLKAPLNSEYDDFGFYMYNNTSCGFISSDRAGGTGSDDIYIYNKFNSKIELSHDLVKIEKAGFFNGISVDFFERNGKKFVSENDPYYNKLKLPFNDSTFTAIYTKDSAVYNNVEMALEKPNAATKYALQIKSLQKPVELYGHINEKENQPLKNKKLYVFENEVLVDTLVTNNDGNYNMVLKAEKQYRIIQLDSLPQDLKPKYLKLICVNAKAVALSNVEVIIKKQNIKFNSFNLMAKQQPFRIPNNTSLSLSLSKKYHLTTDTNIVVALPKGVDTLVIVLVLREIPSFVLKGHVYENFKNEKIGVKNVDVEFHNKGKVIDQNMSYESGDFEIRSYPMEKINLTLNKKGYVGIDTTFMLDTNKIKSIDIELKRISEGVTVQLKEIYFEYNKASIMEESKPNLEKIAKFLRANPGVKVELSSHTDARGSAAYNLDLSQRRAETVTKLLIANGVKANKLKAKGYGASMPIIKDAQTEEQHQVNRRTEIKIISADLNHNPDFKYRIVVKSSDKPLDLSDDLFMKFPLAKSASAENGDLIYFVGPYEHLDDVKMQWNAANTYELSGVFVQKILNNTVIEKYTNIDQLPKD